jgi:hypothetical protein
MVNAKTEIEKALAGMLREATADVSEPVIRPAITMNGNFNKKISTEILTKYWYQTLECQNLEQFNALLNAIVGTMGLNLSTDVVEVAMICNALRWYKGLNPL